MRFILSALLVSLFPTVQAQVASIEHPSGGPSVADAATLDTRSDSIDISHTTINLDFSALPTANLIGACQVNFSARVDNISQITLDLQALTVDSVKQFGEAVTFNHTGTKLRIDLLFPLQTGNNSSVEIFYHGTPVEDASGFGGFSFSGGYAYNIGVGFAADPHNFGRVWFPCFDNFVERCTFSLIVKTPENLKAYCGGILEEDTVENGFRTRHWTLNQEVPSYLASVAVAPYTEVNYTYSSMLNPQLNVKLAAVPGDTTAMKNAFVSLEAIFHEFESHFGPYRWDRIGYVMTPFQAGAMEHATNIGYPRDLLATGAAGNQHIMAHELSHHWFGDLATCRTASEMWLTEGFASYCERLFDEWLISRATYDVQVRANHRTMVNLCHVKDGGYWPLSNVPQAYTYTTSTYERPSDIIHTLRTYMGDSLFYVGLKHYFNTYTFRDANSNDLRDALEAATNVPLHDFFADWVDTPGWGQFEIDSMIITGGIGNRFYYSQKSAGNTHTYTNVPFELTCRGSNFELFTAQVVLSGPNGFVDVTVPFEPVYASLNRNEAISHAVTAEERFIKTTGNANWANALLEINTSTVQDSVLIRVEHNWVAPDPFKQAFAMYRLSPNRYWHIDGVLRDGFKASAKFTYNGRTSSTSSGWLDNELITDETKLVLLYRKDNGSDWTVLDATKNTLSSTTDKYGSFTLDSLMLGEYTFAEIDSSLGIQPITIEENSSLKVFPNPAKTQVSLTWEKEDMRYAELFDMSGRSMGRLMIPSGMRGWVFPVEHLAAGTYLMRLETKRGKFVQSKVIIEK
jgi:aminopeptidase N